MYRIAIVDDNQEILDYIAKLLDEKYGCDVVVSKIKSKEEYDYLAEYEKVTNFDIMLIDIVLDDALGIDFANEHLIGNNRTKIIFITGYTEYIPDIFKSTPTGIVVKPITKERLYEAVDRAMELYDKDFNEYIKIITKEQIYNIAVRDIMYVESAGHHISIHASSGIVDAVMKLSDFQKRLEDVGMGDCFIRCHQSFIVNSTYIRTIGNKTVQMNNNVEISISRSRITDTKEKYLRYLVTRV